MQVNPTSSRPTETPLTTSHLKILIVQEMSTNGSSCNLNHIDVSSITDFRSLFEHTHFDGDISDWNVSRGRAFSRMFANTPFTGDLSRWDTSNAETMNSMFSRSSFSGDVSNWNVAKVKDAMNMFYTSPFAGDLSKWIFANDVESWGPDGLSGLVGHHKSNARRTLLLPMLPLECQTFFRSDDVMQTWLAAQLLHNGMTRYHWDGLLRQPDAPWASPELAQFVQTYLSIAPPLPSLTKSCVEHSTQIMHMWERRPQHQTVDAIALPLLMESSPP